LADIEVVVADPCHNHISLGPDGFNLELASIVFRAGLIITGYLKHSTTPHPFAEQRAMPSSTRFFSSLISVPEILDRLYVNFASAPCFIQAVPPLDSKRKDEGCHPRKRFSAHFRNFQELSTVRTGVIRGYT